MKLISIIASVVLAGSFAFAGHGAGHAKAAPATDKKDTHAAADAHAADATAKPADSKAKPAGH